MFHFDFSSSFSPFSEKKCATKRNNFCHPKNTFDDAFLERFLLAPIHKPIESTLQVKASWLGAPIGCNRSFSHGGQKTTNAASSTGWKKTQSGCMKKPTHENEPQCNGECMHAHTRPKFMFEHWKISTFVQKMPLFRKNGNYFWPRHRIRKAFGHVPIQWPPIPLLIPSDLKKGCGWLLHGIFSFAATAKKNTVHKTWSFPPAIASSKPKDSIPYLESMLSPFVCPLLETGAWIPRYGAISAPLRNVTAKFSTFIPKHMHTTKFSSARFVPSLFPPFSRTALVSA